MTPSEELKKAEHRGYSRGYAAGLRAGRYRAAVRDGVVFEAPLPLSTAPAAGTSPLAEVSQRESQMQDGKIQLLESLTRELSAAIEQGRLHLWGATAHSVVDYLVDRYGIQTNSISEPAARVPKATSLPD